MSKLEALFLQDLINHSAAPKTVKADDGYFLCTVEYLQNSLNWEHKAQARYLSTLTKAGYISVRKVGIPPRRWIYINFRAIEEALDKCIDSSPNGDDQSTGKGDEASSPKWDESIEVETDRKEIHCCSMTRNGGPLAKSPDNGIVKTPAKSTAECFAKRLYDTISRHRRLMRPVKAKDWCRLWITPFVEMLDKYAESEVTTLLDWYESNFDDQFTPRLYSAKSFCDEIHRIERARQIQLDRSKAKRKKRDNDYGLNDW
jgi:hypothetical protein